ncbi:hypothetical protein KDL45_02180 [bacterium]|nr:hypothetical protein [bacterium]
MAALVLLVIATAVFGQEVKDLIVGPATAYNPIHDHAPSALEESQFRRVYDALCDASCGPIKLTRNITVPTAAMVVQLRGARLIYSPTFMDTIMKIYGPSAPLGVFAHELGHLLDFRRGNVGWMHNSWDRELRADSWAGCALAKLNMPQRDTSGVLQALAQSPTHSHPDWTKRVEALKKGYAQCGGQPHILDTLPLEQYGQTSASPNQ